MLHTHQLIGGCTVSRRIEIFHRGEYFNGPLPIRLLVQLHARYVIWATQKHINSKAFGGGDLELQDAQRGNIPMYAVQDFFRRLVIAQQVAMESGKIAAGASTEKAEETLEVLKKLQGDPSAAYVRNKRYLKRTSSTLELQDPEAQRVVDAVLKNLSKTEDGRDVAKAALDDLMRSTTVEEQEPRYGGAFKGRMMKMVRRQSSLAQQS